MSSVIARGAAALLALAGIVSCNTVFTDQSDCPRGLSLRFVYDYHMEYVNSFHKQGHCVNVYVFDESGNYVDNWVETGEVIKEYPPEELIESMVKAKEWIGAFLDRIV